MIQFAAEHFEELDKEKIKELPNEIISEIFQNENLKLSEDDSLFEFILKLYEEDHSYANLFGYVMFINVSEKKLEQFVNEFDVEYINNQIFQSICKRFFKDKIEKVNKNRYINSNNTKKIDPKENEDFDVKKFDPKENEDFDGILRYLTKKTGGNIHDNGTIEISSNSISGSHSHPKNSLDYQNDNIYHSNDDSDSFVCIDFKGRSVQISSYSIQSACCNTVHLKNWAIEVSENGKDWIEIDRHSNDSTLNQFKAKSRFNVNKPQSKFYRFVRLHQTGEAWFRNYIGFAFLEFYGKLQGPKT